MLNRTATLLCLLIGTVVHPTAHAATSPLMDGVYKILIRGYWSGEGAATVSGGIVQIQGNVKNISGQSGSLSAGGLALANNHFTGPGALMGVTVQIDGRIDPQDSPVANGQNSTRVPVTTDARLSATVVGIGHAARLAGGRDPATAPPPPGS